MLDKTAIDKFVDTLNAKFAQTKAGATPHQLIFDVAKALGVEATTVCGMQKAQLTRKVVDKMFEEGDSNIETFLVTLDGTKIQLYWVEEKQVVLDKILK